MIMTVVLGTINTFFAIASCSVHAIILLHSDDIGKHSVEGSFARVGGCTYKESKQNVLQKFRKSFNPGGGNVYFIYFISFFLCVCTT